MSEKAKRIMGLDYGSKRIGVALSDPTGTIAHPHTVLENLSDEEILQEIASIIERHFVCEIVVGLPLRMSGSPGERAKTVSAFVDALRVRFPGVGVKTWDERLSTRFVEREMIRDNVRRRKRREVIDKIAAAVILQSYLDATGKDEG